MEIQLDKETALVEAILFLESEPQGEQNLARISELSEDVVRIALDKLREKYLAEDSGIELVQIGGGWSLTPKKDLWHFFERTIWQEERGQAFPCRNGNPGHHCLFPAHYPCRN